MRIDIDSCEKSSSRLQETRREACGRHSVYSGASYAGGTHYWWWPGDAAGYEFLFEGFATNSAFLVSQKTGEAYKGLCKGRWWNLELSDIERLRTGVNEIGLLLLL